MKELFLLKNSVDQFPPHNLFPAVFSKILGIFSVCLFVCFFDLERYHLEYIVVNVCGEQWSMDHPCQKVFFTSTSGYSVMRFYLDFLFFKHQKKISRVSGTELYYKEAYFGVRCEWSLMQCLHYKFYHVALCCIILPVFVL